MAIKTVSLKIEAYERLKAARRYPGESFSEVVLRAHWADEGITAGELLRRGEEFGSHFTEAELDSIEAAKAEMNRPPADKWQTT